MFIFFFFYSFYTTVIAGFFIKAFEGFPVLIDFADKY